MHLSFRIAIHQRDAAAAQSVKSADVLHICKQCKHALTRDLLVNALTKQCVIIYAGKGVQTIYLYISF
jgi:hypothetical protein